MKNALCQIHIIWCSIFKARVSSYTVRRAHLKCKAIFHYNVQKKILNWSRRAVASLRFQFHFCSVTIPSHAALIQNIHSSTVFPFLLSNSFCKVEVSLFSLSSSILNGFSYWTSLTCNNGCGQNFWCFPMHFISISNGTETYNVK